VNVKHDVTQRTKPVLGAKVRLNEKPTGKNKEEMGPRQYATRLFNAEVNFDDRHLHGGITYSKRFVMVTMSLVIK
jgi:hypothetical protein